MKKLEISKSEQSPLVLSCPICGFADKNKQTVQWDSFIPTMCMFHCDICHSKTSIDIWVKNGETTY